MSYGRQCDGMAGVDDKVVCLPLLSIKTYFTWGQRLPTDLTFVHHVWSLLEIAHLLLVSLWPGTVSLKTSHQLHHCQCFDVNWRLACFGTRTQTLLLRH